MSAPDTTRLVEDPAVSIEPLTAQHWPDVERIYRAGIATGHATFESEPPSWEAFDRGKPPHHRWVALDSSASPRRGVGAVLGWVAASIVSDRCVYAGVVEHSVYVDPDVSGRGVGLRLLKALVESTEQAGIWTIQSGIFPQNTASLRLHERAGFRTVGVRERIGKMTYGPMAGRWRDVVFIERRSHRAGR